MLKENITQEKKNIGNNLGGKRAKTRNKGTKNRRVEQKR